MSGLEPSGYLLGSATQPVVVLERELAATPLEVWQAWTVPERLVRWLGAVEAPLDQPGVPVRLAMTAQELPADLDGVQGLATFTVLQAQPPADDVPGLLVLTFDDQADPGGTLTVLFTPVGRDRCRIVLRHALRPSAGALGQAPGFGAGWDGFLDWLDDALAGREHGGDDRYEALLPYYEGLGDRLAAVGNGHVEHHEGEPAVRHVRLIAAAPERIWSLLSTGEGLSRWLGTLVEGSFGPGHQVVVVHDGQDPGASRQVSTVTTWTPPHALAMTWDFPGEQSSQLEITLRVDGAGTRLELLHRGVGAPQDGYLPGWHAHLDLLVAQVEGRASPPWAQAYAAALTLVG